MVLKISVTKYIKVFPRVEILGASQFPSVAAQLVKLQETLKY